jgi:type I restriction enzyme S subunit
MKQQTKFKQTEIGNIPEDWEVKKFEKVKVQIIDGDRGVNYPKQDEFKKEGFCLFLNTKNVPEYKLNFDDCGFISKERDNLLGKGKLNRGDIVLTTRGTVGNVALYNHDIKCENIRINSGMVIIRNDKKEFDTNFLYLLLRSQIIRNQFLSIYTGSAQPQLPIRDLKKINLVIPPLAEQSAIAKILSGMDSKIELNQQMNKTLEAIGQAIFKHWFVDFEFPNEKGKPYKSSGGEIVDSELGEIPKGWKVGKLGDIITELNQRIDEDSCTVLSAVKSGELIRSEEVFNKRVYSKELRKYKKLEKYNFAYNPARINIGSVGMLERDIVGAVSPVYVVFRPKKGYHRYIQNLLKIIKIKKRIIQFCSGTVRQNLEFNSFSIIEIIIPPENIVKEFNHIHEKLLDIITFKTKEIQTISQLRDSLLPKLMSGKIRVPVEKEVGITT